MTYSKAHAQLEKLVSQMEANKVPLEELPAKIKEAQELVRFCEVSLRRVEVEVESKSRNMGKEK